MRYDNAQKTEVNSQENDRLLWCDSLKGIGVILVIIGHLLYGSRLKGINFFIYSFHVPMFFMLSGFMVRKYDSAYAFFRKRFKRCFVPYLAFTFIGILPLGLFLYSEGKSILDIIIDFSFFYGETTNSPLWFLVSIFCISVFVAVTNVLAWPTILKLTLAIACFCAGGIFFLHFKEETYNYFRYFGWGRTVICLGFYILGTVLRQAYKTHLNKKHRNVIIYALTILFYIGTVIISIVNRRVSLYDFDLKNYPLFLVSGIIGSFATAIFCFCFLNKKSILARISNYSVLYLGSQYFAILPFRKIMRIVGYERTRKYDLFMAVVFLFILIGIPCIYELLSKKIKFLKVFNGETL